MARRALWTDTLVAETGAAGSQDVVSLMGPLDGAARQGLTVVRTIISLQFIPPAAVSDGHMHINMGIGVVSQEGFVSSVVPDPNVATDRPPRGWLWRDHRVVAGAAAMVSYSVATLSSDVRGARKVDDGELVLVLNVDDIDGTTFAVSTFGLIRCVLLYP